MPAVGILETLIFYFTIIIVAYILSQVVTDRTPIKVALIATIASAVAHLLVSGIKHIIVLP